MQQASEDIESLKKIMSMSMYSDKESIIIMAMNKNTWTCSRWAHYKRSEAVSQLFTKVVY